MLINQLERKYGDAFNFMSHHREYQIYERVTPGVDRPQSHFEVVKPLQKEDGIHYPSASQWGVYGWTCIGEKSLMLKLAELDEKDNKTNNQHN
jgi:hypothetical protein